MMAFDAFWHLDTISLHMVNDAFLVLLPKKHGTKVIKYYMPIALIHTVGKLLSKVLANKLAPKLGTMIHSNQSTFVEGRFI
jgi:hypothetical protein